MNTSVSGFCMPMPWSSRISRSTGVGPAHDDAAGVRASARSVAFRRASTAARRAHAHGLRQARLVRARAAPSPRPATGPEVSARVVGIGEAQRVAELGDAVLDLDARVHLHEVVVVALDDALEGRRRIEPHGGAEALGLGLHAAQDRRGRSSSAFASAVRPSRSRARDGELELLLGHRDLEQLLLVHLQRAVAAAQRDAPLPLPITWISLWRVVSMLSSIRMFLLSPTPVAFTSARISRASSGASRRRGGVLGVRPSGRRRGCAGPCRRRRRWPSGGCGAPATWRSICVGRAAAISAHSSSTLKSSTCPRGTRPSAPRRPAPRAASASRSSADVERRAPVRPARAAPRGRGACASSVARRDVVDAGRDADAVPERRALGLVLGAGAAHGASTGR